MQDTLRDKIRSYLTGQMPEKERRAFQAEIQEDEYLEAEVDLMRLEITMLDVAHEDWIRGKMKKWEQAYQEEPQHALPQKGFWRKYGLIIGALALLGFLFVRHILTNKETPEASAFGDSVWLSHVFGDALTDKQARGKGPYFYSNEKSRPPFALIEKKIGRIPLLGDTLNKQREKFNRLDAAINNIGYTSYNDFSDFETYLKSIKYDILVINFWATWCAPCLDELQFFEEIDARYKSQGVKVLLVSLDFKSKLQAQLVPFLKKRKIKSSVIVLTDQDADSWMPRIHPDMSGELPTTVFIERDRKFIHKGQFDSYEDLEQNLIIFIRHDKN